MSPTTMNNTTNPVMKLSDWSTTIPRTEAILFGSALGLLVIITLFGNSLVCVVFWRFRILRNLTNYFVCSLAVADLMVPLLRVIYIAVTILKSDWMFGRTWCEISSMCGILLCGASILHLCAISMERLIAIKWPLKYDTIVTHKRVVIVLSYVWAQSILLSLIPALPVDIADQKFSPNMGECEIDWLKHPVLMILLVVFYFVVPVNIMIVAYAFIFNEVRKNARRIKTLHVEGVRTSGFWRDLKAVKTLGVVIGVFFVMWMPYFVTTTIRAFRGEDSVSPWLQRVCIMLAYGNSSCNFVIYALMNLNYRSAFLQVLKDCRERRLLTSTDMPLTSVKAAGSANGKASLNAHAQNPHLRSSFVTETVLDV